MIADCPSAPNSLFPLLQILANLHLLLSRSDPLQLPCSSRLPGAVAATHRRRQRSREDGRARSAEEVAFPLQLRGLQAEEVEELDSTQMERAAVCDHSSVSFGARSNLHL